ncbi:ATP-dependent DNA helicase PcrA [Candidatus Magnetoovum chiemensis]|nr:ATP-dependent DNA helicase PcrA [Candidatus Magnetoovum chiemensis]
MKHRISESNWVPADDFILEPSALDVVKNDTNCYVLAGPGSGKTELLAQRACFLLQTNKCPHPKRILSISFKRDASKNIEERVKKRCGETFSRRFTSLTYDAFAKRILDQFRNSLPQEYRPKPQYEVLTKDKAIVIRDAFDKKPQSNLAKASINIQKAFLNGEQGLPCSLTFKTITKLSTYIILTNEIIRKALRITYSHVFLDEFQDTTTLQYDFMKACFSKSDSVITAVGDYKQRIMVWAGADKEIFSKFENDFRAKKYSLFINHRSAPRLVQLQTFIASSMAGHERDEVRSSDEWDNNDGTCEIWNYRNPEEEAEGLSNSIKEWIKSEKLQPRDICLLVRQKTKIYTDVIISSLKSKDIIARDESSLQDLLSEDCTHIILNYLYAMLTKKARQEWIEFVDLLKYFKGIFYTDDHYDTKIREIEQDLSKHMQDMKSKMKNTTDQTTLEKFLWKILEVLDVQNFKNYFPHYRRGNCLEEFINKIAESLWKEYEQQSDWLKAVQYFHGDLSIPIMTIHKSKGLEYHTVVFVGLEDDALWNYSKRSEEEKCIFFVALSRAKSRVIFTFSESRNIGQNKLSKPQERNQIKPLYELLREAGVVEKYRTPQD